MWSCAEPCGDILFIVAILQRGVRGQVQQDACSRQSICIICSRALQQCGYSLDQTQELSPCFTLCWRTSALLPPCLPCRTGSRAALPHLISLLLCLPTVQFLEGAGGNKPHYIAVCIGTALLSRERPWLPSCLAACRCEVLPSVRAQIPPVQTGAPTQVASCVKTSPSPSSPLSLCTFFLLLSLSPLSLSTSWYKLTPHTHNIIPPCLSQVQLFEKMVETEDGVPLYSQYMEVNSITQSTRDRYMRLTNGIFLNEIMRVM